MSRFSYLIILSICLSAFRSSLSLTRKLQFGPNANIVLNGDAKFTNEGSSVRLTDPHISSPSSGFMIQKKPFKFVSLNAGKPASFSTDFTFSISPHNGDGLAFLIVTRNFLSRVSLEGFGVLRERRFIGVEYDTSLDENVGDVNANHVGVDVGSLVSVKTSNVSSIDLVLNSGVQLHSWIDYDASSKRIEVRLSRFGSARPYVPLLAHQVDLGEMWKNEDVLVGLSSSSGTTMQTSSVYSWNLRMRHAPAWLHSRPADIWAFSSDQSQEKKSSHKKKLCALGFLSGLVFLTGCGALLALIVLFLWALLEKNSETVLTIPAKCNVNSGDFRYEKIKVVLVDDDSTNPNPKN